ncbi:MAG TPA: polysaccharide deacetylase family protein [Actinomycetales bacterium]|nr:polysaccharide deacetylase family protein [Actinomycetales bacterium]
MVKARRLGGLAAALAVVAGLAAGCGSGVPSTTPSPTVRTTETRTAAGSPASPSGKPAPSESATAPAPTTTREPAPTASATAPAPTTREPAPRLPAALRGKDFERIPTSRKVVALTFDAGSSDAAMSTILATLGRENVRATFFLTGDFARRYPTAVSRIASAGHRLGNHSDRHLDYPVLTNAQIRADLARAESAISGASGKRAKPLFRFPSGARTTADIDVVNGEGYVPVRWTVDTLGWKGTSGGITAAIVRDRVLDAAGPGEIVLMHVGANPDDGTTLDADALPGVIDQLRSRGYGFVTLDALLG